MSPGALAYLLHPSWPREGPLTPRCAGHLIFEEEVRPYRSRSALTPLARDLKGGKL